MLQTDKSLYLKTLQVLAVSLSLMLIYQTFFYKQPYPSNQNIERVANQNAYKDKDLNEENNFESKVAIIKEFSEESEQEDEVLSVGRNLFQNSENLKKVSSQEAFLSTTEIAKKSNVDSQIFLISELVPNKIYAQNKAAKILIKGTNFDENTKIYTNDTLLETKVLNSLEIEAILPSHLLSTIGTLQIIAKDHKPNKEKLSNLLTLNLVRPPIPNFTFIGMFSDSGGQNTKLLLKIGAEDLTVKVGDLVKNRWKIASLSSDMLTFEDKETGLSYQVRKGEKLIPPIVEELAQEKTVTKETVTKTDETNLFERSNKPMTSKELWEKRALIGKEKKKL